jgi:hypothetical protein
VPLGGSPGLEGVDGGGVAGFGVAAFELFALFDDPRPHPSPHDARAKTEVSIIETKMNLLIRWFPLYFYLLREQIESAVAITTPSFTLFTSSRYLTEYELCYTPINGDSQLQIFGCQHFS